MNYRYGDGSKIREFLPEGVTLIIPEMEYPVEVFMLPPDNSDEGKKVKDGFTLIRTVIAFEFVHTGEHVPLPSWERPIEMHVRYTPEDVEEAGGLENLKLLYFWDEIWRDCNELGVVNFQRYVSNPEQYEAAVAFYGWIPAAQGNDPKIGWGS